ncbi:ZIP-like iron-zinc transporter [Mucidula mucida]|nr:ZIP-like iron-zinc transporter [Mucidula mucida]
MIALLVMSALLGASSFACGILPLSFALSKSHLTRLTTIGTGLLLGTSLGVIIPEGVEALLEANLEPHQVTRRVALSLLFGFITMLIVEQLVAKHSHSMPSDISLHATSTVEFDAELGDLEAEQGSGTRPGYVQVDGPAQYVAKSKAFPLTLGLIIHSVADGLALGVSFFSGSAETSNLSLIVFLAIIVHKAPTSLALTTSLLAMGLPRADCKKHLVAFASTTPIATIAAYFFLDFFGSVEHTDWTGVALLGSGGTFLYVATVLQPVSENSQEQEMKNTTRVAFISLGMIIPFILGSLGHGH